MKQVAPALSVLILVSIICGAVAVSGVVTGAETNTDTVQLDFSSEYNADIVYGADKSGDFDGFAALITNTVAGNNSNSGDGLPDSGVFPATSTHPRIELDTEHTNNSNNAWQASGTGQITTSVSNGQYEAIHIISSAGGTGVGTPAKFETTLHYADESTGTSQEFRVPDWFGDKPSDPGYALIDGMDRYNIEQEFYDNADEPAVWGFAVPANSNKTLEKITINVTENDAGSFNFLGGAATTKTSDVISNNPPTANDDSTTTDEDASVTYNVVANDDDRDGDDLEVIGITDGPSHGTAEITGESNDQIQFDPGTDQDSDVSIEYELSDGSSTATATLSVTVNDAPEVSSVTRTDDTPTNAEAVSFDVTFDTEVDGVDNSDFTLYTTGTASGTIQSFGPTTAGNAVTVTVESVSGDGDLRLEVDDDDSIQNTANSAPLGGDGTNSNADGSFTNGETYTVDNTAPSLVDASRTDDTTVEIGLSDKNTGFDVSTIEKSDFSLNAGTIDSVDTFDLSDGDTGTQTVVINLDSPVDEDTVTVRLQSDGIDDLAGNTLDSGSVDVMDIDGVAPTLDNASKVDATTINVDLSDSGSGVEKSSITSGDFNLSSGVISSIDTGGVTDGATGTQSVTINLVSAVDTSTVTVTLQSDGIDDKAGNTRTSGSVSAVNMDGVAPIVASITRSSPADQNTNAESVDFAVTFSESVTNISTSDFSLSGTASGSVSSVNTTSGTIVTVTGTSITGNGPLGVTLASSSDIADSSGNSLDTSEPGTDEVFIIDNQSPLIRSFDVTAPTSQDIRIRMESDEPLLTISTIITGAESATLTKSDFNETITTGDTFTYNATYEGSTDGDYTATLETAADNTGNDGARNQSDTVTIRTSTSSSGSDSSSSPSPTDATDTETSVAVTETIEGSDSSGDDGGDGGTDDTTPDTTVSVSNPQPGQTLIIENGQARIVDADTDPEADTDDGQSDDAAGESDTGGSDDGAGNVRADRLSVDLNTDQDFTLSVTTYESDLTRSSAAGQRSQPPLAPPVAGAVGAVDASIVPRAEPPAPIAQIDAPETVRAAAESFEADTATVSAGYVDVEHTLGDGAIAGATFAFSIRRAYLEELGVAPEGVTLYHRLDGEWETRETEYVDSGGTYYRFEGTMPEFSVFALGTGAATIEPTAATVDAATIDVGAEATVTATVTNRGQTTAEDSIELTLDGDVVDTETVTLDGGASRNVTFTVAPDTPGAYDLAVGSIDLEPLTVEEPDDDPEETDSSPPWGIIGIAVALVVVLALGVVALRRR